MIQRIPYCCWKKKKAGSKDKNLFFFPVSAKMVLLGPIVIAVISSLWRGLSAISTGSSSNTVVLIRAGGAHDDVVEIE